MSHRFQIWDRTKFGRPLERNVWKMSEPRRESVCVLPSADLISLVHLPLMNPSLSWSNCWKRGSNLSFSSALTIQWSSVRFDGEICEGAATAAVAAATAGISIAPGKRFGRTTGGSIPPETRRIRIGKRLVGKRSGNSRMMEDFKPWMRNMAIANSFRSSAPSSSISLNSQILCNWSADKLDLRKIGLTDVPGNLFIVPLSLSKARSNAQRAVGPIVQTSATDKLIDCGMSLVIFGGTISLLMLE